VQIKQQKLLQFSLQINQNLSSHIRRAIRKSYFCEVMRMDSADWFEVFRETGEPMAYLLCAAAERLEVYEAEEEILPSA
jgi:hypothetical protein